MHYAPCKEGTVSIHGRIEDNPPYPRAPKYEYRPDCLDWARKKSIQNSLLLIYTSMRSFMDVPYAAAHQRRMLVTHELGDWEKREDKKELEKRARRVSRELVLTRDS